MDTIPKVNWSASSMVCWTAFLMAEKSGLFMSMNSCSYLWFSLLRQCSPGMITMMMWRPMGIVFGFRCSCWMMSVFLGRSRVNRFLWMFCRGSWKIYILLSWRKTASGQLWRLLWPTNLRTSTWHHGMRRRAEMQEQRTALRRNLRRIGLRMTWCWIT